MEEEKKDKLLESEDFIEPSVDVLDLISSEDELEDQDFEKVLDVIDEFEPVDLQGLSFKITNLYNRMFENELDLNKVPLNFNLLSSIVSNSISNFYDK